jgi:small-conductance mechanosensitive channel
MRWHLRFAALLLMFVLTGSFALAGPPGETKRIVSTSASADTEAPLEIFNRTIVTFRSTFLGATPDARAARAQRVIEEMLRENSELSISTRANPEGLLVMLNDRLAFVVVAGDADPLREETMQEVADKAKRNLQQAIDETREARNLHSLLQAILVSAGATAIFAVALWALARFRVWFAAMLLSITQAKVERIKVSGARIFEERHLLLYLQRLVTTLRWLLIGLVTYEWLSFVLSRFPYTRPWGERLNDYLWDVLAGLLQQIVGAIPDLGVALVIFLLARFFIAFLGRLFERIAQSGSDINWLSSDTMPTTRRLFAMAVWLFAVAMAYPYLPGAHTDAFKGVSVLLGLMVSLGASSIVGQGAAGLILTYTRTLRPGEYVRIGEHEGTVVKIGFFTTSILTGQGEELTLPNSVITGNVTKNYSRTVNGPGFVVDTTVTIGYDTPWRQVEAMLIEAARRTPGVLATPAPCVFQTSLSDYYPEYRLVAQAIPSQPRPRAVVLTMLHANIQDVFNEYGVQIMSPHYMADTAQAKVVSPEDWFREPAREATNLPSSSPTSDRPNANRKDS